MLLALIGFIILFRKQRDIFFTTLMFTLLNIYIVYSWDIWWYGGSLGSRAMIQSYAVLLFPLAAFVNWIWNNHFIRTATLVVILFCIWLNLIQTYQAHAKGIFEAENMTRAY